MEKPIAPHRWRLHRFKPAGAFCDKFDIHVKIWGDSDLRQLLGQLLPRTARLHLLRNGERIETTAVDEMGEFHFSDVPDGDLSLQIDLPSLTVIGALNVRQSL